MHRLLQDRIEYRRKVPQRAVDRLQYLGSRGLLFQRFALLGQEASVLDGDDRLIGEGSDKFNLSISKRLDPLSCQQH
jgi:hypothetical protein